MNLNLPHTYRITSKAEKDKEYKVSSQDLESITVAPPSNFGGPGNIWSPEDLFVATVSSCFLMTFKAVSQLSKLEWIELECDAEGMLDKIDSKLQFTEVNLKAKLKLPKDGNEERAIRLMHKAEQNCLVTNSLKTKVILSPIIILED